MRSKKSIKNFIFGIGLQLLTSLLGLVNRTVLIKFIGDEALSLNSLFTEVLSMLALAELGVGAAITFSLYKPLSEDDHDQVSRLMNLFSKAYKIVAATVFIIGVALVPFIQFIVKEVTYPISYIRVIYVLFVIQTSSSYLFSYLGALITADQKRYIVSSISMGAKTLMTVFQIVLIITTRNYIYFLLCSLLFTLVNNIVLSIVAKRMYPYLDKSLKLDKAEEKHIFSDIKSVFIARISGTITNSTDNTLISVLVGTLYVGYYNNYAVFFNIVKGIINQFTNAVLASFGNLLVTESNEHAETVFRRVTYIFFVFGGICCTGLLCVITPVITLWLGEDHLLDSFSVSVCILCLFINVLKTPLWTILDSAGLFKENSYTGIAGSLVNLAISIILGLRVGMAGIFIGTICTYLIQGGMKIYYLYNRKLSLSSRWYVTNIFIYFFLFVVQSALGVFLCNIINISNLWLQILVNGIIALISACVFDLMFFAKTKEFKYFIGLFGSFLGNKLKRLG